MPDNNFERVLKMAEFINKYQQAAGNPSPDVSSCASALDKRINTPELAMIKSAIPHLEPRNRRLISVIIKLIEIQRLLDYLKETAAAINRINAGSGGDENSWRIAMLELIMPHLSPASRAQFQTIVSLLEMMGTLQEAKI
ncbi:MAG: hypothetical protein FWE91_06665 [Defluviitaleaceae bacterium]|nr:hypothetical protein [Defluviitaleaceae bacterium]MCL2836621.1 hypothetical protein [Defluviitaleaceae bacterium]